MPAAQTRSAWQWAQSSSVKFIAALLVTAVNCEMSRVTYAGDSELAPFGHVGV